MRAAYTNDLINALEQLKVQRELQSEVPQIWYTKADLCRHFGITYNTLKRWEQHKRFPLMELRDLCTGRYDIRKIERFIHKLQLS